jgi:hypothetical protein
MMSVALTHYSLRSAPLSATAFEHPKTWYVEVSDDAARWEEVHRCTDNHDLNGSSLAGIYEVNQIVRGRYVRVRQIGCNHHQNHRLMVCAFEIFGTLFQ